MNLDSASLMRDASRARFLRLEGSWRPEQGDEAMTHHQLVNGLRMSHSDLRPLRRDG